ncbi:hypothetical protein YQE_02715, partial [Dendroctonus ponderosae]
MTEKRTFAVSAILVFDSSALLNQVLVPADAAVGSVIYRLRASDTLFDYPLFFQLKDSITVALESLNCTRFNSRTLSLLKCAKLSKVPK